MRPHCSHSNCQGLSRREPSSPRPIYSYKIGIAKLTDSCCPIFFASRPQIATSETAEHRCSPSVRPFTLKGIENLFHRVTHKIQSQGVEIGTQGTVEKRGISKM